MKKIWHDEAWSEYCKCFIWAEEQNTYPETDL